MGAVNPQLMDLMIQRSIDLIRYEQGLRTRILVNMNQLHDDLEKLLRQYAPTEVSRVSARRARAEKLLVDTRSTIRSAIASVQRNVAKDLAGLAELEANGLQSAINGVVGVDIASALPTAEAIAAIASDVMIDGAPSAEWWARLSVKTQNRFSDIIRQGMLKGESTDELAERLMGFKRSPEFGKPLDQALGIEGLGLREGRLFADAEALVRTSIQTVANTTHLALFEANADIMKGIMWVSTLDNRTTPICRALDGLMWNTDHEPIGHKFAFPGPIAHWGCRSTQVPVLKSYEDLAAEAGGDTRLAAKMDKLMPEGTRASMDGQVPGTLTYETWLKRKDAADPAMVTKVLGPKRAEMWRDGKVGFTDLISQKGRALTLKELAARQGGV